MNKKSNHDSNNSWVDRIDWGWIAAILSILVCIPLFGSNKQIARAAVQVTTVVMVFLIVSAVWGAFVFHKRMNQLKSEHESTE